MSNKKNTFNIYSKITEKYLFSEFIPASKLLGALRINTDITKSLYKNEKSMLNGIIEFQNSVRALDTYNSNVLKLKNMSVLDWEYSNKVRQLFKLIIKTDKGVSEMTISDFILRFGYLSADKVNLSINYLLLGYTETNNPIFTKQYRVKDVKHIVETPNDISKGVEIVNPRLISSKRAKRIKEVNKQKQTVVELETIIENINNGEDN